MQHMFVVSQMLDCTDLRSDFKDIEKCNSRYRTGKPGYWEAFSSQGKVRDIDETGKVREKSGKIT